MNAKALMRCSLLHAFAFYICFSRCRAADFTADAVACPVMELTSIMTGRFLRRVVRLLRGSWP